MVFCSLKLTLKQSSIILPPNLSSLHVPKHAPLWTKSSFLENHLNSSHCWVTSTVEVALLHLVHSIWQNIVLLSFQRPVSVLGFGNWIQAAQEGWALNSSPGRDLKSPNKKKIKNFPHILPMMICLKIINFCCSVSYLRPRCFSQVNCYVAFGSVSLTEAWLSGKGSVICNKVSPSNLFSWSCTLVGLPDS